MKNITLKLYSIEYAALGAYLETIYKNANGLGFNAPLAHLALSEFFNRRHEALYRNASTHSTRPRSLTLRPAEAKALYDELLHTNHNDFLQNIIDQLDRALINQGFQNTQNN